MPKLLLLETTTDICSVTLAKNESVLATRETADFKDHGRVITVFIEECVQKLGWAISDIDAVAVSAGPGSFTGLRIGYSTAKGLCMGLDIPLISVDTLAALAKAAIQSDDNDNTFYAPMLDARSMGVYLSIFDQKLVACYPLTRQKIDLEVLRPFTSNEKQLVICGSAAHKYEEELKEVGVQIRPPFRTSANFLLPLALKAWEDKNFADIAYATPNYVAPPNITTPKPKKSRFR